MDISHSNGENKPKLKPEDSIIPAKVSSGKIVSGQKMNICVNGYELDISKAIEMVYKFELKFYAEKTSTKSSGKTKMKELHRGPKNDVALVLRHHILWKIFIALLEQNETFFGQDKKKFFYDCGTTFYSIEKLFDRYEGEREFQLQVNTLSSEIRDFVGRNCQMIVAKLLPCEEIFLSDTTAVADCIAIRERSLQQFLEIATTQMMYHNSNSLIFGNKTYDLPSRHMQQLTGGKVLASGMEKSVRFVGNEWETAIAMVQIDSKKGAFFKEGPMMELINALINRAPMSALINDVRLRQKVAKQLKDLVVRTTHLPSGQRTFSIFGITAESADNVKIIIENQEVSVTDYILHKYQYRLKFGILPCAIERRVIGKDGGSSVFSSFHPLELLHVIGGQRVSIKKQNPELVDDLIKSCRVLPSKLKAANEEQRLRAFIDDRNEYLAHLGIKVISTPKAASATVVYPPAILYNNGKIEPDGSGNMDWRLSVPRFSPNRLFLRPANPPRRWVVFTFNNATDKNSVDSFIQAFIKRSNDHGIKLTNPSRSERYDNTDISFLIEKMKFMQQNHVEYVLFVTGERRDPVHDVMKFIELSCKIVTQHIQSKTLTKAISNRGAEMTLDNLIMKMNLKLGGLNHGLVGSQVLLKQNRLSTDPMTNIWLRHSRMIIGLDVSHSAPQSLYERQAKIAPSEPTVVGMAYSCGSPLHLAGEYWMQQPRLAVLQNLKDHIAKAIKHFRNCNSCFPEHVLIYRGGVSEGQYLKVMIEEAASIRAGFVEAIAGGPEHIRLTIITVQTNSNYRIVPLNIRGETASEQNVPAGTFVDADVVHPTQTEFVMVAHKSIMGTARPVRCTVLVDDPPRMLMDELKGVTNALCYGHEIVTSPVSIPAHLYAASDLAKRGRNNWKVANDGDSQSGDGEGGRYRNNGHENFFEEMSTDLKPSLAYKFWA